MFYRILFIFLILSVSASAFDRKSIHEARFDADISINRTYENSLKNSDIRAAQSADDILVSESYAPAKFNQDNGDIAQINDSTILAVFSDNRDGSLKIFGQLIKTDGQFIGSNFIVTGSDNGSDYVDPKIETDQSGNIFIFFRDRSSGLILGTRYLSDLTVDLSTFLVNDTLNNAYAGPYDFSIYNDGKFVVVWEDYSNSGSLIKMKIYGDNGLLISGPITVNNDGGSSSHWVPAVEVDNNGNILVVWEDYRSAQADIYAQLFDGSGLEIGSEFALIPSPANLANQYAPEIIQTGPLRFIIGWVDQRSGQEIYGQVYSVVTGLVGSNSIISSDDTLLVNWNLDFCSDDNNMISASFASFGPENLISLQPIDSVLNKMSSLKNLNINNDGQRWQPALNLNDDGTYSAVWSQVLSNNSDIMVNFFQSDFTPILSSELTVNDDLIGAPSSSPSVCASSDWYKLVAFSDKRNDGGDIFVQAVSNSGLKINSNIKVNQDNASNLQSDPDITASIAQQISMVVWVDSRDINAIPGQRIFGRLGDKFGVFRTDEFLISDSASYSIKNRPQAAMNNNGLSMVSWIDERFSNSAVLTRLVSMSGNLGASEVIVSDTAVNSIINNLQNGIDSSNNFYIFWHSSTVSSKTVEMKKYSETATELLSFSFTSPIPAETIDEFDAALFGNGYFAIAYTTAEQPAKLYLTVFDDAGSEILAPTVINDQLNQSVKSPAVSVSNNDYISICWVDTRSGRKQIYYQLLDNSYSPLSGNTLASSADVEYMKSPKTVAVYGRAFFSWVDPRLNGDNIYASLVTYLPTDIDDGNNNPLPDKFILNQNYPNPFNPTTKISFSLPKKSFARLVVFNMLGQEVKVLAAKEMSAGNHIFEWNGTNESGQAVASGLYFYKLETDDFSGLKKMILIK